MNQALSFGLLGGGGILLTKALTGSSFSDVVKGHPGKVPDQGPTLTASVAGVGSAIASGAASTATGVTAAGKGAAAGVAGAALPSGGQTHGLVSIAALQAIGAKHGWSGQQITDWMNVVMSESNGTLTDTNSSSGAYGIAQGITGPSWYAANGGDATTLSGQLTAMANYIAGRYGNPSAAWAFHQSHNWY